MTFHALAQNEVMNRLTGIRQGFERGSGESSGFGMLLAFIGAGALIVLILFLLQHFRQRRTLHLESRHPTRLLGRALRSMGVGWIDRCIVRWIAGSSRMTNPAILLLCRQTFDASTRQWLQSIGFGPLRDHLRQRLASVSEKAFGAS